MSPRTNTRARGRRPGRAMENPLAIGIGTRFTARVEDLTAEGSGVVRHPEGQVFFVPGVWLQETVEVRVTGFRGRLGFGEVVAVVEPSPHRVEPPCPYQGHSAVACGGCPWQFVDYQAQLNAKQDRVEQALEKLADAKGTTKSITKSTTIKEIWAAPSPFGYRNRAQLKTDGAKLGYMASASNRLVDVADCLILTDKNRQTLKALRQKLPESTWCPRHKKSITTLDIDETVNADSASVNRRLPFQQSNSQQNERMREWLKEKLEKLDKGLPVLELFAGSGNFTEVIARSGFARITAVEVADEALDRLRAALPSVDTLVWNLFDDSAAQQLRRLAPEAAVLVLDPPRDGLKNDALKSSSGLFHKRSKLQHVFYISCNLATLVRDLELFVERGFAVREVQPLDQFPHTPHIELLVHLERKQTEK